MLAGDFEPGFYVKHFLKDMDIALKDEEMMELNLPGLKLARSLYNELVCRDLKIKGHRYFLKGIKKFEMKKRFLLSWEKPLDLTV